MCNIIDSNIYNFLYVICVIWFDQVNFFINNYIRKGNVMFKLYKHVFNNCVIMHNKNTVTIIFT